MTDVDRIRAECASIEADIEPMAREAGRRRQLYEAAARAHQLQVESGGVGSAIYSAYTAVRQAAMDLELCSQSVKSLKQAHSEHLELLVRAEYAATMHGVDRSHTAGEIDAFEANRLLMRAYVRRRTETKIVLDADERALVNMKGV